jgi:lysophospholipase L1-like esterase
VLESRGAGARVYGVRLEAEGAPGILWSTLGLPGATSAVWLRPDEEEFVRLLGARPPHLAVVMLGGNDGLMLSKGRTTLEAIERDTTRFIRRIRAAAHEADCLVVSPLEAVRAKTGGRLIPKPEVPKVIAVLRRVAEAEGCGFWDMYASMGGKGALKRWVRARLMLGDLIHPRSRGSDLLGEMMAEAIMDAYDAARAP